jgi:hypothetical protein
VDFLYVTFTAGNAATIICRVSSYVLDEML